MKKLNSFVASFLFVAFCAQIAKAETCSLIPDSEQTNLIQMVNKDTQQTGFAAYQISIQTSKIQIADQISYAFGVRSLPLSTFMFGISLRSPIGLINLYNDTDVDYWPKDKKKPTQVNVQNITSQQAVATARMIYQLKRSFADSSYEFALYRCP